MQSHCPPRDNKSMRRLRPLLVLALFLFHSLGLAHEAAGQWRCEGKQCSVNFFWCCCKSPTDPDSGSHGRIHWSGSQDVPQACSPSSECGCEFVETSECTHQTVSPTSSFAYALAQAAPVLLSHYIYTPPASSDPHLRRPETRGPPLASVPHATPSLRAPPCA